MATWVNNTSQSTGGNIKMQVAGGYSGVSRSGNTVSGNVGIRFIASQWTYNSISAWYGGVRRWAQRSKGGVHTASGGTYYANAADTPAYNYQNTTEVTPWSFSTTVSGAGGGNVSISITAGWNGWTPTPGYTKTFNVPYSGIPGDPTYSVSVSPSRTSATMTMSISSNPSNFWRIHWYDTGGSWKGCSGFSTGTWTYTQSNLNPNTSYSFYTQIGAANDTNLKGTVARSFTTTGNAPTATGLPVSNITRTGATVSISGTYDTNASWGGWELQYGTSTSYGSSTTNGTLTGLTPNTTYYVRGRFKDNWGRWSGWVTNSFTTTGNAPTISSVTPDVYRNKAVLNYSASYDTNDSYKSLSIQYGTSTSYGSTSTSTTLSSLQPNTIYYYSMTVTSNKNRTSSAKTGSFKTTAYLPSSLSLSASNTLPFTTNLAVSGLGDTNAGITNYTYYYRTKPTKPTYDMAIKSLSDGSTWARIFYHNNKIGTVLFSSINECKNAQTVDKYSRLYLLEDNTYKGSDGKFEFMLCYPIDAPGKYNRWKQTNAPQNEFNIATTSGTKAAGYQAIHIDWTSNYFGGLERFQSDASSLGSTWLDGSVGHGNWYYAIGVSTIYQRGIPSATDVGNNGATADVVELWVRIDDAPIVSQSMGTSTTVTVSGLAEETDYIFFVSATNAAGTNYSRAIEVTTLADQAKIRIKGNALPDTYQRVEYIQTDGAQMINLGKVGDTVATYDIAFIDDNHRQLMGYGGSGTEYWGAHNSSLYEAGGSTGNISITTSQRRTITWTYNFRDGIGGLDFDGHHIDSTPSKNVDNNEYKLFNILNDASPQYGCACKLYGLQMWHYGNLVRNLIPCYRKSDNVIGLFDTVGMTFYTNIGTGNFTKGNNIATGTGWLKGKTYYKKNGAWVKAKKIYIKVDGQWKIGTNYDE